jgi:hypothetical protein
MSERIRKRTIAFDASVLAAAERLCSARGIGLSAFVNAAVQRHLKVEEGRRQVFGKGRPACQHSHP